MANEARNKQNALNRKYRTQFAFMYGIQIINNKRDLSVRTIVCMYANQNTNVNKKRNVFLEGAKYQ